MGTMESGKWKAHRKKFYNSPLICSHKNVTYNFTIFNLHRNLLRPWYDFITFLIYLSKYWIIHIEPCQRQSQKISEELQNFFQGAFHFPLSISPICVPKSLPNFPYFFLISTIYLHNFWFFYTFNMLSTCFPRAFHCSHLCSQLS